MTESKCVLYLHSLGKMGDLKKIYDVFKQYDDNYVLCKFGRTINDKIRKNQHKHAFSKHGFVLNEIHTVEIHSLLLSNAETDLKKHFKKKNLCVNFKNYKELVYIPTDKIDEIKEYYEKLKHTYSIDKFQIPNKKMKEYICDTCDKKFNKKSGYTDHLNRKNPCKKIEVIDIKNILQEITNLKTKLDDVEKENKKLKEMITSNDNKNITNNNTQNNNTLNNVETMNVVNIVLNGFGNEELSHLTEKQIREILKKGFKSIPKYIEYVHFNDKAPSNKNICITNRRDNTVNVYNGKKWILQNKEEFLDEIRGKGMDFIYKNVDELDEKNIEDQKILKIINRFIKSYEDEDKDKLKMIDKDIQLILYNNNKDVKKPKKVQ
jgi:hypothetical protein